MSEFSSLRRLDANRIFWQESVKILKRRVFQLEVNLNAVFRGIIYSLCRFDPKPMFWKQKLKIWQKTASFLSKIFVVPGEHGFFIQSGKYSVE